MRRRNALILTLVAMAFFGLAAAAAMLSPAPAQAADNPCDPTPGILLWCKQQHGHFSSTCCCCVTH